MLAGRCTLDDAVADTAIERLKLVPAHPDLARRQHRAAARAGLRDAPARGAGGVRERFEHVLLDCPPSLGPLTVNALVAADRVIVPVQTEYFALEGLAGLLDTLALIQRELNPRLTIAGMLLTMHDGRTRLARDVEREVREHFPDLVFDTVIPRNVRVGEAPSFGRPVTHHAPHAPERTRTLSSPRRSCGRGWRRDAAGTRDGPRPRRDPQGVRRTRGGGRRPAPGPGRSHRAEPEAAPPRVRPGVARGARGLRCASAACCSPCSSGPVAGGTYELVAGERRWRAAKLAGLETIPALIRDRDDAEALEAALIENMAREDLNPVEEARACAALVEELGLTRESVGLRVGRSRVAVTNLMRLLDLPDDVLDAARARRPLRGPRPRAAAGRGPRRPQPPRPQRGRRGVVGARRSRHARGTPTRAARARPRSARPLTHPDQQAAAAQIADALGGALGIEVTVKPRGRRLSRRAAVRRPGRGACARAPAAPARRRLIAGPQTCAQRPLNSSAVRAISSVG